MDHHFSKIEYFINCGVTLLYTGLVAGAYTDTSSCPYTYDPPADVSLRFAKAATALGKGTCRGSHGTGAADGGFSSDYTESFERCGLGEQKYLFRALSCGNGLSCHMIDVVVWAYIVGLLVFMTQKYIAYRIQGLHYFFLDYCYFHSFVMTVFLLHCLVDLQWSAEPLVRWKSPAPSVPSGAASSASTRTWTPLDAAVDSATRGSAVHDGLVQIGTAIWRWVQQVDGVYYPTSARILTCGYAMAHHTRDHSFLVFLALLGGAFGPLYGAIIMWRNALLFHSFDRMSSSYLHLLPGIVQGLLLHRLFTSARTEARLLDPEAVFARAVELAWRTNRTVETWLPAVTAMQRETGWSTSALPSAELALAKPRDAQKALSLAKKQYGEYARQHGYNARCGYGTDCFALEESVTYGSVLRLHFYMFMVWQIFYHTFHESRRRMLMMKERRRQVRLSMARHAEVMALSGSTDEEAELLKPPTTLAEGAGGDPTFRVTSYTWMFEHPPGGKKGLPYRFCNMLGPGRLPTTVLFQVAQWVTHMIFYTLAYPVIYFSFHTTHKAWPLLLQCVFYTLLCVYNAACVDGKWIGKLQMMAEKGLDSERMRLSMTQPPLPAPEDVVEQQERQDEADEQAEAAALVEARRAPSRVAPTPVTAPHPTEAKEASHDAHVDDGSGGNRDEL